MALQLFFQKVDKIKNFKKIMIKNSFVTPNFWYWNLHHFWVWIFLSSRITICLVWKTENAPKWVLAKQLSKIKPRYTLGLVLGSSQHQKRSCFIISQTCAKSSDLENFGYIVQNTTNGHLSHSVLGLKNFCKQFRLWKFHLYLP